MNESPIIQARGVAKRFGDFEAIASLDLDVRKGQCVGLLGPNGAGKSTFIGCLYGVVSLTGGELRVFGLELFHQGRQCCVRAPRFDDLLELQRASGQTALQLRPANLEDVYLKLTGSALNEDE
jgi:ABC-type multidrug transport system ATPase subunit